MPFDTKIVKDGIIARYFGTVTFDDVMKSSGLTWGHPIWDTAKYYITDFLDADMLEMSPDQAMALAHMDNASMRRGTSQRKYAFVVTSPQVVELLEIFMQSLDAPNWEIRMFADMERAIDWAASGH
jgi:hypothetical protein